MGVRRVLAGIVALAEDTRRPHVVYRLGSPLRIKPIPTGKHYRAIRFHVLVDQLLTCETLADAQPTPKANCSPTPCPAAADPPSKPLATKRVAPVGGGVKGLR